MEGCRALQNPRKSGRPRQHSDELSTAVVDAYWAGRSITDICKQHGVARATVYTLLRRHGVHPGRRPAQQVATGEWCELLYDITAEQEQIIDHLTEQAAHLRHVLDTCD
jgi:transposase-like protein